MKLTINIILTSLFAIGFSVNVLAELELDQTNKSLLVPGMAPAAKGASASISSANLKDLKLDKTKLLRCWQYGQLIVAENGWQNPSSEGKTMLTKSGERMVGYDYGETFCLYMSN